MSAAFTPGPWVVCKDAAYVDGADGKVVAYCRDPERTPSEIEANANLIAAAPKLFAAVKRAIWLIEDAEKDTNWCSGDPYSDDGPVKDFRALLAEAEAA